MNDIKKLIKKIDEKMKSKQGKKLKKFVKDNKKSLEKIEKQILSSLLASIGLDDGIDKYKLANELTFIKEQDPERLIQGVTLSAHLFKKISAEAVAEVKEYNSMLKELSISGAKALLPFIISLF